MYLFFQHNASSFSSIRQLNCGHFTILCNESIELLAAFENQVHALGTMVISALVPVFFLRLHFLLLYTLVRFFIRHL